MTMGSPGAPSISIPRSALRTSRRTGRENAPLVRGGISDCPDESSIEIPHPIALGEEAEPIRVLHVDDDPQIVDLTSTFLQRIDEDFTILTETNVVAALNLLQEEDVDCIISDYDMPNTDGLEFLEIVRERFPDLPFILFTGKGSEEIASEAIARGVTDYMQKGVRSDQYEVLANRVQNAVEQYRTQQQFWNALSWYQRLVEEEIAGVFIVQGGEFVYVNETLAEIFQYGRAELVGESPLILAGDEDEEVREALLESDRARGETFRIEFTGRRSDDTPIDVAVHGGTIEYEGDLAAIGILRDRSRSSELPTDGSGSTSE